MTIDTTIDEILKNKRPGVWYLPPEATVFDAIELMAEHNIGALLVMDQDRLLGVMSERDYTRKVALRGRSSKGTAVREIVSTPLISVTPAHCVEDCMRLMTTHRVRHLPVMQGGEVVGIVSIGDLVNWIISAQHSAITQLEAYITGNYPG
jgi:CBS domain-containing protein